MLTVIKALHTAIYAVMVAAILYILYCGITGTLSLLLAVSIGLVALEGAVFLGNGRKCPLTALAQRYGDPEGYVGDIFLPEWLARRTFSVFSSLSVLGLLLVAIRLLSVCGNAEVPSGLRRAGAKCRLSWCRTRHRSLMLDNSGSRVRSPDIHRQLPDVVVQGNGDTFHDKDRLGKEACKLVTIARLKARMIGCLGGILQKVIEGLDGHIRVCLISGCVRLAQLVSGCGTDCFVLSHRLSAPS